jgi:hypothetical protein
MTCVKARRSSERYGETRKSVKRTFRRPTVRAESRRFFIFLKNEDLHEND